MNIKTGFITPKFDPKNYILGQGNVPLKVLKKDGDWRNGKQAKELQAKLNFDTCNCTGFNALNQIEQYEFIAFGETNNYSDRWLGIVAGTKPPGNDPQVVYEAIRKYGLIPDEMLPYSDDLKTIDEYYSFKGADKEACYAEGKKWLERKKFYHEWVWDVFQEVPNHEKINNMKVALRYSPLALAVFAWAEDEKGIYVRLGGDTHWTSMPAYDIYQRIYDSYEPIEKNVDQEIFWCKRIHIEKVEPKLSFWSRIWQWFIKEKLIYRDFKIFNIKNNL